MDLTFSIKSKDDKMIAKNLSLEKVKRFIDEGKINDHDLISKDGSGQWHPASKYKTNRSKAEASRQEDKPPSSPVKTKTVESASQEEPDLGSSIASIADTEHSTDEDELKDLEGQKQYEIITSFGMFWRRKAVQWLATPKLLGMKKIDDTPIDFHKQIGIYLLYDGREVIYVGRITERPLGKRLYEHTIDRLSTRWDRFSWFGLLSVSDEGEIGILPDSYTATDLIPALEAILIEALEPRQNRKRGDDLAAVEYIQKIDPAVEKKRFKATLDTLLDKF